MNVHFLFQFVLEVTLQENLADFGSKEKVLCKWLLINYQFLGNFAIIFWDKLSSKVLVKK